MDDRADRDPIVSEGPYAIVDATDDEQAEYRLVASTDEKRSTTTDREPGVPIDDTTVGDLAAAVSRLRGLTSDVEDAPGPVELTCHDCGKTWTHAGSDEHATCPNCETEVPLEGIGP